MIFNNFHSHTTLSSLVSLSPMDFDNPEIMEFLSSVYHSTRMEEMKGTNWALNEIRTFLDQQFKFQHQSYTTNFPNAKYYLILAGQERCGRFYVDFRDDEIRVLDIALLPQYRSQKIGTQIMKQLIEEAKSTNKRISIHVEKQNMAVNWYKGLGFIEESDNEIYIFMVYNPYV